MINKSSVYKYYLYFSLLILATLAAASYLGFDFLKSLYMTSIPINSTILFVVLGSIYLVFHYIFSVCRDIRHFDVFTVWCEDPDTVEFDVESFTSGVLGPIMTPMCASIQEKGRVVISSTSEGRSMVEGLEQSIDARASLVAFLVGFLVLLGLLGTFLGLTITLQSMGDILKTLAGGLSDAGDSSIVQVMVQLIVQLQEPMAGMGTAFSTSLFGLAGSGVVSVLAIFLSRIHGQLTNRLEAWLNMKTLFASEETTTTRISAEGAPQVSLGGGSAAQLEALSTQLLESNQSVLNALNDTNKFLLKMTILQQRSAEVMNTVQTQSIETTKEINHGNELSGRLIRESRQLSTVLERFLENKDN